MKWFHVSDLHFHPGLDGRSARELRESLPAYLQAHIGKVDEVFMTGDFRHARHQKADPDAAKNAVAFLREIAQSVGVSDSAHIHIVPGNHDLARDESPEGIQKILDITEKYDPDNGRFNGKEDFLWERFSFFREVASLLHGGDTLWLEHLSRLHPCRCLGGYSMVYTNTAIAMGRMVDKDGKRTDDDRGNMVIGNDALDLALRETAEKNPGRPVIVLAHHAMELFSKREREAVEEILHKYPVAAYLCGDAHEPWCKKINRVAEVTMGCITYGKGVQAVFSVGEITPAGEVTVTAHEWRSHPGGWGEYSQFNHHFAELFPKPAAAAETPGPFGRDALIEKISACLRGIPPGSGKIVEVYGEPGIGKTTVCGEVMKSVPQEKRFQAALRGMASCTAAQDQILRSLGVAAKDDVALEKQIDAFAKTAPGATLYLDNAEDPLKDAAFKAWLLHDFPARSGWRVLYSTRTHMKHTSVTPFYVPPLDMPDAKGMFRSLFGDTSARDEATLEALLKDLSCHPLSIVLVAAQKDLYPTVQELHRAWRSARGEAHDRFQFEDDTGPHASLKAALTMSFEAIRDIRAARVLWGMMSFLPAQLPMALLTLAFADDPPAAEAAAAVLIKNSLMKSEQKDGKAVYAMLNPIKDKAFAFEKDAGLEPVREEAVSRLVGALTVVYEKANEFKAKDRQESHYFALDILPDALSCVEAILAKNAVISSELFALLKTIRNHFKYNTTLSLDLLEKIVPDRNDVAAFYARKWATYKAAWARLSRPFNCMIRRKPYTDKNRLTWDLPMCCKAWAT